jgi:hypothetical protein
MAVAIVAIASAVVWYLLRSAAIDRTSFQRLKHARCRRSVGRGHPERSAERSHSVAMAPRVYARSKMAR